MKKVEAITVVDEKLFREFYIFNQFRCKFYKKCPMICYILTAVALGGSVAVSLVENTGAWLVFSVYAAALLLLCMSVVVLAGAKIRYKMLPYQLRAQQRFVFTGEYVDIHTHAGSSRMEYNEVSRVYETDRFFLLCLDRSASVMIDKQGSKVGNPGILRNHFEKRFGKRFKCFAAE